MYEIRMFECHNNLVEKNQILNIRNFPYSTMQFYKHASIFYPILLPQGYEEKLNEEGDIISLLACQIEWLPPIYRR